MENENLTGTAEAKTENSMISPLPSKHTALPPTWRYHGRRARICGNQCGSAPGTVRWSTAVNLALEVADGRPGTGGAVALLESKCKIRESVFFSLCSVAGRKETRE